MGGAEKKGSSTGDADKNWNSPLLLHSTVHDSDRSLGQEKSSCKNSIKKINLASIGVFKYSKHLAIFKLYLMAPFEVD